MKKTSLSWLTLLFSIAPLCHAEIHLGHDTSIHFASVDEAEKILTKKDDFIERLSAFDRAARMKTDKAVSEEEFLIFVGRNVLAWSDEEKRLVESTFDRLQAPLEALSLSFPRTISLVKTSGNEEGQAAYTRSAAIVFPANELAKDARTLEKLICHELFHVLSRENPRLRERLYETIGFTKCDEVEFPPQLKSRKITNPDAPKNNHYLRVSVNGHSSLAVPILVADAEHYDTKRGGEFFDYLKFKFLLVEKRGDSMRVISSESSESNVVGPEQVSGFMEQIGENTQYVIHPEEILADNFALLVLKEENLPSPDIIHKMEQVLTRK